MSERARIADEVHTLLLDLRRLQQARRLYPAGDPALAPVSERTARAWRSALEREGPLQLRVEADGLRLDDAPDALGHGDLQELARCLTDRGVTALRFGEGVAQEDLDALAGLLCEEPGSLAATGGAAAYLERAGSGALTLETGPSATPAGGPSQTKSALAYADEEGLEDATQAWAADPADPQAEKPSIESAPLDPRSCSPQARGWFALLQSLEAARGEDAAYARHLVQLEADAAALRSAGVLDELYRGALVLWSHETDAARSEEQRECAGDALRALVTDVVLDDVIRRASVPEPSAGLHASRLLLHLGDHAAPRVLALLESESDPNRTAQLQGILIALGDAAAPFLIALVESGEPRRARQAVQVLGEMRCAQAVDVLGSLLGGESAPLRNEAARALVRIGTPEARGPLLEALHSTRSDVAGLAAFALGATRDPEVIPVLLETLEQALTKHRVEVGLELIKGLGRLAHPDAVPALVGVLERRSLLHGRSLRELKLAATSALGRIPGDTAHDALRAAAEGGDPRVQKLARLALDRRGGAGA